MNNKNIVFLIPNLEFTGVAKVASDLATELAKRNNVHFIIHSKCENKFNPPLGAKIYYLSTSQRLSKYNLINRIKYINKLKKTLKQIHKETGNIDAIFASILDSERLLHHCNGYQKYYVVHNNYTMDQGSDNKNRYKRRMNLAKKIYENCDLITVSTGVKK